MSAQHVEAADPVDRFAFGENWSRFLRTLNEERIRLAVESLRGMLGVESLQGKRFLDIGCGSGLFSLAARQLGAHVHSFDYDRQSVACTEQLRERFFAHDPRWTVQQGSALDADYLASLGQFDVVYSWGVLHHTGNMQRAFALVGDRVAPGGKLFIAIYNDQGSISRYWTAVKRIYNRNALGRIAMIVVHTPYLYVLRAFVRAVRGRGALERGMSLWHDMIDWLGGYPFEVATPEAVFRSFRDRGFALEELRTCRGRMGCNEFVLRRLS